MTAIDTPSQDAPAAAQASAACEAVATALAAAPAFAPWLANTAAGTLWVGFSGGLDSTVLLHALRQLPRVAAVHIEHGLDAGSEARLRHCVAMAETFGIVCHARSIRVGSGNMENAARQARYAAWARLLGHGDLLALAHHADDQAETRLWQVLTGREPGGMPAMRAVGKGQLVRPLLTMRRRDLAAYAKRWRLQWIEDPSNANLDLDRNYIRTQLMPLIEQRFPAAIERLAAPRRAAEPVAPLPTTDMGEQRIKQWLGSAGLPLADSAIAELGRQSAAAADRNPRVAVAPCVAAWRYRGRWHLVRDIEPRSGNGLSPAAVGQEQEYVEGQLGWQRKPWGLAIDTRFSMRWRRGGERLRPAGRNVTKSIKALFQERHVPPWQRRTWPLLYDTGDRLIAVPGLAIAAEAATPQGLFPVWKPAHRELTSG